MKPILLNLHLFVSIQLFRGGIKIKKKSGTFGKSNRDVLNLKLGTLYWEYFCQFDCKGVQPSSKFSENQNFLKLVREGGSEIFKIFSIILRKS